MSMYSDEFNQGMADYVHMYSDDELLWAALAHDHCAHVDDYMYEQSLMDDDHLYEYMPHDCSWLS